MTVTQPPIEWVYHPWAKRLRLRVTPQGIRLTLPPNCRATEAERFLQQQQDWLQQQWQELQQQAPSQTCPDQLQLAYDAQPWQVVISSDEVQDASGLAIRGHHQGAVGLAPASHQIRLTWPDPKQLTQAVCQLACDQLPERLHRLASQHQFRVTHVRIATPRTRWGSCRADGRIMLHAGLLLMPPALADAVIWHELNHLQHRHHQSAFWQALQRLDADALTHARAIRRFRLPGWWQP